MRHKEVLCLTLKGKGIWVTGTRGTSPLVTDGVAGTGQPHGQSLSTLSVPAHLPPPIPMPHSLFPASSWLKGTEGKKKENYSGRRIGKKVEEKSVRQKGLQSKMGRGGNQKRGKERDQEWRGETRKMR